MTGNTLTIIINKILINLIFFIILLIPSFKNFNHLHQKGCGIHIPFTKNSVLYYLICYHILHTLLETLQFDFIFPVTVASKHSSFVPAEKDSFNVFAETHVNVPVINTPAIHTAKILFVLIMLIICYIFSTISIISHNIIYVN